MKYAWDMESAQKILRGEGAPELPPQLRHAVTDYLGQMEVTHDFGAQKIKKLQRRLIADLMNIARSWNSRFELQSAFQQAPGQEGHIEIVPFVTALQEFEESLADGRHRHELLGLTQHLHTLEREETVVEKSGTASWEEEKAA